MADLVSSGGESFSVMLSCGYIAGMLNDRDESRMCARAVSSGKRNAVPCMKVGTSRFCW